jgi:hypothetical protein
MLKIMKTARAKPAGQSAPIMPQAGIEKIR